MILILAALIALIGSQILDGLKTRRDRAELLISQLEDISEEIEKIIFDEFPKISYEIENIVKGILPQNGINGLTDINFRFKYRISSLLRIYFNDSQLEVFFDQLYELYVDLGEIRVTALKAIISNKLIPLDSKKQAEINSLLDNNEKKYKPCLLNIMGTISSLGNELVKEKSVTFWSFTWELWEKFYKFIFKSTNHKQKKS